VACYGCIIIAAAVVIAEVVRLGSSCNFIWLVKQLVQW